VSEADPRFGDDRIMLEWLALIAVFVLLFKLRSRVSSLEESSDHLRVTIADLRAKLLAQEGPASVPRSAPSAQPQQESQPHPDVRPEPTRGAPVLPPEMAAALRRPPVETPVPVAAMAASATLPPAPPAPPVIRPPRRSPAPLAPEPPAPPFDWEKLIGVKLFSWIAGAALALAAVFFLRYSMDHGWLRPEIRMAIGLLVGIGLLVTCELKAAREYPQTANAMDAAGIAILFATTFASFALWHLVPPTAAFAMLALVTAVAVLLSIRRNSIFIALLGLLGGFATPVLLSSGQDNPIGLFGYLLLLNIGLAWVAYRKRWPLLTAVSMVLSTVYQWGWVMKFLRADKLPIAVGIFLVFPIVSVIALALGNSGFASDYDDSNESPLFAHSLFAQTARVSAALPLLFGLYLATVPEYGAHSGILFGFLFCLSVGLFALSIAKGPHWLHALGALSTVATFTVWFQTSYTTGAWPWLLGIVSAFVLFYLSAPFIAAMRRDGEIKGLGALAVFAAPLLLFAFPLLFAIEPLTAAPWLPFGVLFALLAACAAFAIAARLGPVHYVASFFALAAEAVWSSRHLNATNLYSGLALYGMFGLFYVGTPLVARRFKRGFEPAGAAGVLTLASLGLLFFVASGPAATSALWGMALLIAVLNVGLFLESTSEGMPLLSIVGTALSWVVLAVWWYTSSSSAVIVPALVVMAGFALLTMGGSAWARSRVGEGEAARGFDANIFMGLIGHAFIVCVVTRPELSIPPWPVFGALAVLDLAVLTAALYLRNGVVHLGAAVLTAVILMLWAATARVFPWPQVAILAAGVSAVLAFLAMPLARRIGARDHTFDLTAGVAVILAQVIVLFAQEQSGRPDVYFLIGAEVVLVAAALSLSWIDVEKLGWFAVAAVIPAALGAQMWRQMHLAPHFWTSELLIALPVYLMYVVYPLLLGKRAGTARAPFIATVVATIVFFFLGYESLVLGGFKPYIGALPVVQALLMLPVLARLVQFERARAATGQASGRLALVAAATLACVTVAIPLQLDRNWITIGWALEGAALVWLFRRIPHAGLLAAAVALLGAAFARLALNPAVLAYHARGAMPILNWYLYTYLVCAAALFIAARFTGDGDEKARKLAGVFASAGTVLLFLLLNIEIADFYATGATITFNFNANLAQDLTYTIGWAVFSLGLLAAGIVLRNKPCRIASIALLTATVAKCFLHDLGRLGGLYRVGSFVGLAICLSLVAIGLQKFVLARDTPPLSEA
jgi:uncharacterized membrane protein